MAVPDFQSLMMPLLRMARDGQEHSLAEARDVLAAEFKLSDTDREEPLPSGRQSKFSNRIAWAKSYLQQAGLLLSPRRGHFQMSDKGCEVLKSAPARIDIKFLEQYPEFVEFRNPKGDVVDVPSQIPAAQPEPETPEEALEAAHLKMRIGLASELLSRVKAASPQFFERLVVELLLKMGYGGSRRDAGQAIGRSGDEGIDGVISEDRLGLDVVYLQVGCPSTTRNGERPSRSRTGSMSAGWRQPCSVRVDSWGSLSGSTTLVESRRHASTIRTAWMPACAWWSRCAWSSRQTA